MKGDSRRSMPKSSTPDGRIISPSWLGSFARLADAERVSQTDTIPDARVEIGRRSDTEIRISQSREAVVHGVRASEAGHAVRALLARCALNHFQDLRRFA